MSQDEINEVHMILLKWFEEKKKEPHEIMSFLTATWIGQMCLNGYKEEFVDATLKRMKESWKNHWLGKE